MRTSLKIESSTQVRSQNSLRNLFLSFSITLFIFSALFVFNSVGINENSSSESIRRIHYDVQKEAAIKNELK